MAEPASQPPGPGVDAQGRAVVDPTENVKALTEAAVKRLDDLAQAEAKHLREVMRMSAEHDKELRNAEAARIDAIRAVDVGAVQRAAEVAAAQAEALRNQVAAAATATAAALAAALDPIQKSIDDLRRAQYEAQGQKTQVVEARAGGGAIYAFVGAVLGVVGLTVAIILAISK